MNRLLAWLLDDWTEATYRSLSPKWTRRQLAVLRWQWWLGRGVKAGVLLLALLVGASFLAPGAMLLWRALLLWCLLEEVLLLTHVVLAWRYGVSFGWALHHARPMLLGNLAARRDMKLKALLAAAVGLLVVWVVAGMAGT